jgi:branched-chain amino acid transport system substrate-binding protein
MKGNGHWRALLALLLAFGLIAAACGDSDDDGEAPTETTAAADTTAAPEDTGAETTTAPETTAAAETTAAPDEGASGEPIKIGVLTPLTGNFAPWGLQVRDGMRLAAEEINAEGGVDGRMIELVEGDTQSDAEEGGPAFERLAEEDVVAMGGVISSDVGLATSGLAEELQIPTFLVKAGASDILTPESRYVFRTCLPSAPMVADPIAQYAEAEGLTRVGAIIADYGWGHSIEEAMQTAFGELEGVELQIEVAPVPEQDFTTYLRNLEGLDPELIIATGHPPGSGPITVQSADLGIDVPVTGAWSVLPLVMEGAGDAAIGKYSDFDCADYASEDYQDLARRYLAISDNGFMDDDAVAGYGIVTMVADAVANVGDDPTAIAEYLHGQTYDLPGYAFEMGWTEWGELATAQPIFTVIGEGPAPEGVNEAGDWYPETLSQSEPLEPYMP